MAPKMKASTKHKFQNVLHQWSAAINYENGVLPPRRRSQGVYPLARAAVAVGFSQAHDRSTLHHPTCMIDGGCGYTKQHLQTT
jgi:hypothetical protein